MNRLNPSTGDKGGLLRRLTPGGYGNSGVTVD